MNMAGVYEWKSMIGGVEYSFSHTISKGKHILTANGVVHTIKLGVMSSFLNVDEGFDLDGRPARLVMVKGKPDVVVDGVHLQSGKPYVAQPKWVLVFAILCIAIPIVSLGGALPLLLGLGGVAICLAVSKMNASVAVRVIVCAVVTAAAWAAWYFLILAVSSM
jgi:hypothetical protein